MHQLTKAVPRRHGAVPHSAEGAGEVAEPHLLGAERGEPVARDHRQAGHVSRQPERNQQRPAQPRADAVARHQTPSPRPHRRASDGPGILSRSVQEQQHQRHHQDDAAVALRCGQRSQYPRPRPPSHPRLPDAAHRQGQEQRLAVDRGEEVRHRAERDQHHCDRCEPLPELERGQAVEQHERHAERDQRDQHACHQVRADHDPRAAQQQWIQREERGPRGIVAVARVRDREVPRRVPARERGGEQVAEVAERGRETGGIESGGPARPAEREHRQDSGGEDHQPRGPQGSPRDEHSRRVERAAEPAQARASPRLDDHARESGTRRQELEPPSRNTMPGTLDR